VGWGRPQRGDLRHRNLIVAKHAHVRPQLAQILHQVVGK